MRNARSATFTSLWNIAVFDSWSEFIPIPGAIKDSMFVLTAFFSFLSFICIWLRKQSNRFGKFVRRTLEINWSFPANDESGKPTQVYKLQVKKLNYQKDWMDVSVLQLNVLPGGDAIGVQYNELTTPGARAIESAMHSPRYGSICVRMWGTAGPVREFKGCIDAHRYIDMGLGANKAEVIIRVDGESRFYNTDSDDMQGQNEKQNAVSLSNDAGKDDANNVKISHGNSELLEIQDPDNPTRWWKLALRPDLPQLSTVGHFAASSKAETPFGSKLPHKISSTYKYIDGPCLKNVRYRIVNLMKNKAYRICKQAIANNVSVKFRDWEFLPIVATVDSTSKISISDNGNSTIYGKLPHYEKYEWSGHDIFIYLTRNKEGQVLIVENTRDEYGHHFYDIETLISGTFEVSRFGTIINGASLGQPPIVVDDSAQICPINSSPFKMSSPGTMIEFHGRVVKLEDDYIDIEVIDDNTIKQIALEPTSTESENHDSACPYCDV